MVDTDSSGYEANEGTAVLRAVLEVGARPQVPQKRALSGNSDPQKWQRCIVGPPYKKFATISLYESLSALFYPY